MKRLALPLVLISLALLLSCCQKEDRLRPDCSNPFFGLYSPYAQVKTVRHIVPGSAGGGDSIPCLSMQWLGLRLISVAHNQDSGQSETYRYDQHNRLAAIDSNVLFTYNGAGLLASIKVYHDEMTRVIMFQYDGQLLPTQMTDSIFMHPSSGFQDWYGSSQTYQLEWMKGNLEKATPVNDSLMRYEYIYDDNHNPFSGLALSRILIGQNILEHPTFFCLNNVKDVFGYNPDGSVGYYCHYDYDYNNGWPLVVRRQPSLVGDSVQTFILSYR